MNSPYAAPSKQGLRLVIDPHREVDDDYRPGYGLFCGFKDIMSCDPTPGEPVDSYFDQVAAAAIREGAPALDLSFAKALYHRLETPSWVPEVARGELSISRFENRDFDFEEGFDLAEAGFYFLLPSGSGEEPLELSVLIDSFGIAECRLTATSSCANSSFICRLDVTSPHEVAVGASRVAEVYRLMR